MAELSIFFIKLALATFAFVLIGWFGARDRRIAGMLLTFPLLNGIAMLTGVDPVGIAATIYLIVLWNCLLFLVVMHRTERLPPLRAGTSLEASIVLRAAFWIVLWAVGAALLAWFRDALPSAGWLFALAAVMAAVYVARWWRPPLPESSPAFARMWLNARGVIRIACFFAAFGILSAVAYYWRDDRWVGWASALPLPGIFALATLSVTQRRHEMASLGDTVMFGPLLVIPFNWLLARAIIQLRADGAGTIPEIVTVLLFWIAAAALVFVAVPWFARRRDRCSIYPPSRLLG
jgi:hypothetical protein